MRTPPPTALLSLIFEEDARPEASMLDALGAQEQAGGFAVTHVGPASDGIGCAELLINGLTFDCHGLAPWQQVEWPGQSYQGGSGLIGLDSWPSGHAISLSPGAHIAAGAFLLPVVQGLVALGCRLAELPGVVAVCWHPAGSVMEPAYFRTIALDWVNGGVFPALGLVTFHTNPDGALESAGLRFFTGQELSLQPRLGLSPQGMAQLAIRLVDRLVVSGRVQEPQLVDIDGMNPVLAVPDASTRNLAIAPAPRED